MHKNDCWIIQPQQTSSFTRIILVCYLLSWKQRYWPARNIALLALERFLFIKTYTFGYIPIYPRLIWVTYFMTSAGFQVMVICLSMDGMEIAREGIPYNFSQILISTIAHSKSFRTHIKNGLVSSRLVLHDKYYISLFYKTQNKDLSIMNKHYTRLLRVLYVYLEKMHWCAC